MSRSIRAVACLLWALALHVPLASAQPGDSDDPRPRSGIGGLVVGIGGFVIGGLNFASMPFCFSEPLSPETEQACVGLSLALGVGGLTAGITGLAVGLPRRSRYREWRARQHSQLFDALRVAFPRGGATLRWATKF